MMPLMSRSGGPSVYRSFEEYQKAYYLETATDQLENFSEPQAYGKRLAQHSIKILEEALRGA